MQRISFVFFLFFISKLVYSQENVLWATRLIGFSSEFQAEIYGQDYRATQVLGRPNTIPPFWKTSCAWSPSFYNTYENDWIEVGFDSNVRSRQIVVVENSAPGAINRAVVYDKNNRKYTLELKFRRSRKSGKIQYIALPDSGIFVSSVKLVLSNYRSKYYQIDAIGLCEIRGRIDLDVNLAKDAPQKNIKERLDANINTKESEVAPMVSIDGKTLFFTRGTEETEGSKQDVWYAKIENDIINIPKNIGEPINNNDNNGAIGLSPDGKTLYLINCYLSKGKMAYGISKSTIQKNDFKWSFPKELKIEGNNHSENDSFNIAKYNNAEYSINPEGNVLILSIKQKNTIGSRDLYISFLKLDSTWTRPRNLGAQLNTAETESCPFIAYDNKTMYFTSYGHPGYGGGDIFITRRLDDSWLNWSMPENLGPAINTNKWEGFFTVPASGDYAFFSSNYGKNNEDIFRAKPFESIKPIPTKIDTIKIDSFIVEKVKPELEKPKELGNILVISYSEESSQYKIEVPVVEISKLVPEGYFTQEDVLEIRKNKALLSADKSKYLIPLKVGQKISMGDAMFDQSKYTLLPTAIPVLDKISEMMLKSPTMELLVEGHTDNLGDFDLNLKLSQDRVNEVKHYLEKKNISTLRIQTKAWGPSKPRASNETEESRKKNRRVEFTIMKI